MRMSIMSNIRDLENAIDELESNIDSVKGEFSYVEDELQEAQDRVSEFEVLGMEPEDIKDALESSGAEETLSELRANIEGLQDDKRVLSESYDELKVTIGERDTTIQILLVTLSNIERAAAAAQRNNRA
jgi:chromosome segregation ATPase